MASIYDIAKIASGDPLGAAADAAKEADIIFQQYQNQKERVEEVNKAIAEAKRKQKKNKFGYGLGGSLLGGLLGAALASTGIGAGLGASVTSGIGAGLGSGIAEKYRQDRTDSTKKLRELRSKYKNRAISDDITEAIDAFEMEKDAMLQTDTIANALTGAMLPFASEKVTSLKTTPAMASQPGIGIGEAADLVGNLNVPMDVFTETIPAGFKPNKELISAITGLGKETLDELDFSDKDIVAGLLRVLGPQAFSAVNTPRIIVDPLYQPQFRNPFGGF
tara:strand:- start:5416 stop:6246 length:831 start_codon:yes stop_codon:yes gene_type:complete